MQNLSFEDYQELIKSEKMIVIDFWASWCGPCKMFAPVFEKVATEMEETCIFAKVDVDNEQQLATSFNIFSIPTLVVLKDGKEVARKSGYLNEEQLKNFINSNK